MKPFQFTFIGVMVAAAWMTVLLSWLSLADGRFRFDLLLWLIVSVSLAFVAFSKERFPLLANIRSQYTVIQGLISVVCCAVPIILQLKSAIDAQNTLGHLYTTKPENEWLYFVALGGTLTILSITFLILVSVKAKEIMLAKRIG